MATLLDAPSRRVLITGAMAAFAAGQARGAEADIFPVVETAHGKVRGLVSGGIKVFKGLRYGADTAGANRFRPPQPLAPWTGVRDAFNYSNYAPQVPGDRRRAYADLIFTDFNGGGMGEDCLGLNLWTPTLDPNARKPVLVRFHGGGFYGGSSNAPGTDGESLSRFGDCVVITVNHRLGAFGYLHLADSGAPAEFGQSGVVGMLDLVAALDWVKQNIAAFGGDPGRVLIWGQSGGGAKVSHLLAMPAAKGLFHRAGVMSGSRIRAMDAKDAAESTDRLLKALGLTGRQVRDLQRLPFSRVLAAQSELEAGQRALGQAPRSFSPVLDAVALPRHPFDPAAPMESADVPMIVSTVLDDRTYRMQNFGQTWDGVKKILTDQVGARADSVLAMYRNEDPLATPMIIQGRVMTDTGGRKSANTMAERKAAQGRAPVWTYLWKQPSPAYDGRYGAPHGVDVPPSMHEVRLGLAGSSRDAVRLADQMASIWVNFAAKGDPNNPHLPKWEPFTASRRTTLVIDRVTYAADDPRGEFRELWRA